MRLSSYLNLRVPNFSLHALREVLHEAGLDWEGALERAEIDPDAAQRPGGTIPASKELAFQLEFVSLTQGRIDLWAIAAKSYTLGAFGVRGLAFITAPSIEAWVLAGATDDTYALFETAALHDSARNLIGLEISYPDAPQSLVEFSAYRELIVTNRIFRLLYGCPFPFSLVEFPLSEVDSGVAELFPCNIICGSEHFRIYWEPEVSREPLPFGNQFQYESWLQEDSRHLDELRESGDWPDTVKKVVKSAPHLNRKLANVAGVLRISPRTLQRNLRLSGLDFAHVRDAALNDVARELLSSTSKSVSEISRLLGYSEPASFSIAFKRWNGVPPSFYKEAAEYRAHSLTDQ